MLVVFLKLGVSMSVTPLYSSFSAYLTSALVLWRNPNGEEKNWLNTEPTNYDLSSFFKRVITTEILSVALIVFNVVETLLIASITFGPCFQERNLEKYLTKVQETAFASFWNLEILFFNPFCKNLVTNESFFRYSLHKFPSVSTTNKVMGMVGCICFLAASFFSGTWFVFFSRLTLAFCLRKLSTTVFLRKNDITYLNKWSKKHQRPPLLLREDTSLPKQVLAILKKKQKSNKVNAPIKWPKDQILLNKMRAIKTRIGPARDISKDTKLMGDTFLVDHILNKISDPKTHFYIVESDSRAFPYLMTLIIYTFVLGSMKEEAPDLLMESTRSSIFELRQKTSKPDSFFSNISFSLKKLANPKVYGDCATIIKQKPLLMQVIQPREDEFFSIDKYENREKYPEIDKILKALQGSACKSLNEALLKEYLKSACALWLEKGGNLEAIAREELTEELESKNN